MTKRQAQNMGYLALAGIVAIVLVAILLLITPAGGFIFGAIRVTALLGYLAIFASIVSSLYVRELVRFFGRSFIATHHAVAITGLVMITLHPISVIIGYQSWQVIIPRFSSWRAFLERGGPPAWVLLVIGALAAVWARKLRNSWRTIHYLTYLAFAFGTVHGILIGTDLQLVVLRWLAILMAVFMLYVMIAKRVRRSR